METEIFRLRKLQTSMDIQPASEQGQDASSHLSVTKVRVNYSLPIFDDQQKHKQSIPLNPLVGKELKFVWNGDIRCLHCNRLIKKTYNNGYCYPCFIKLAQNDLCQLRPELCHFHKKTCRDQAWAEKNCFISHTVYLSFTSGLKVGITRSHTLLSRWADQGAEMALPLLQVRQRFHSGLVEVFLKKFFYDKTYYPAMLANSFLSPQQRQQLRSEAGSTLQSQFHESLKNLKQLDAHIEETRAKISSCQLQDQGHQASKLFYSAEPMPKLHSYSYPMAPGARLPAETTHAKHAKPKFTQLSFTKTNSIAGRLLGIRAQYLLFETGILNARKFSGYCIKLLS